MSDDSRRDEMIRTIRTTAKVHVPYADDIQPWIANPDEVADALLALPATNPGAEMFEAAQERIRVKADRRSFAGSKAMKEIERLIVDYFEAAGADIVEDGIEWFLSLYDEGPAISLTALAIALSRPERGGPA